MQVNIGEIKNYGNNLWQNNATSNINTSKANFSDSIFNKTSSKIQTNESAVKFNYDIDDGKISWKNKLKNFAKGLISPVTSMFSSAKNFLTGAAIIAGGALLIAATGGAAAPVLVALGATAGALQIGIGTYKAITAKTDAAAEQAWQDIGGGTSAIALSTLGAKSSLKANGTNVSKMNSLKATATCIKIAPKAAITGTKNIGTTFANILSSINNFIPPGNGAMPELVLAGAGRYPSNIRFSTSAAILNPAIATANAATATAASGFIAMINGDTSDNVRVIWNNEKGKLYKEKVIEKDGKLYEVREYDDIIEIYDEDGKIIETQQKPKINPQQEPQVTSPQKQTLVTRVSKEQGAKIDAEITDDVLNSQDWRKLSSTDKNSFGNTLTKGKVVDSFSSTQQFNIIKYEGDIDGIRIYELKTHTEKRIYGYKDPKSGKFIFDRIGQDQHRQGVNSYKSNFRNSHSQLFKK